MASSSQTVDITRGYCVKFSRSPTFGGRVLLCFCYIWLYMVIYIYGYIWLHMVIYMVIYGYIWLVIYGYLSSHDT